MKKEAHDRSVCGFAPFAIFATGIALAAAEPSGAATNGLSLRARVTAVEPDDYVRIQWRWGGEGLGGEPRRGEFTAVPLAKPSPGADPLPAQARESTEPFAALGARENETPPVIVERGKSCQYLWLRPGTWSPSAPASVFKRGDRGLFLTVTIEGKRHGVALRGVAAEFEFSYDGKVIKTFSESGPDGPTVGIFIPALALDADGKPTPAFVDGLGGLLAYATRRAEGLEALPWAKRLLPKRYAFVTDCYGYKPGLGYAARTANKDVLLAEARATRQLGVNGLRGASDFLMEMAVKGEGIGKEFRRIRIAGAPGFPVPRVDRNGNAPPGAGCPYFPAMSNFAGRMQAETQRLLTNSVRGLPMEEVWLLTADEIGSVFDLAPERKDHQGSCPYCRRAFQDYVRKQGLSLADFGTTNWADIRSTYGYWAKTREEQKKEEEARKAAAAAPAMEADNAAVDLGDDIAAKTNTAPASAAAAKPEERKSLLSERGQGLLYYWSRRFNNESTAMLFSPLRDALDRENERKRAALAAGKTDSLEARQPWVYSYALRGNTFLLGGHSLDFFEFYRLADNGFMYETSNRDPRVWAWDSYLCDVGRILRGKLGKRFGIYIKPHRGAPIQRALTAVSRDAKVIYWYTYGPNWVKGDSFSASPDALRDASRAARLIATAEEALYDGAWAAPAEVAVVRPLTSEYWENSASWENGKWIYAALTHAHIPVDPLDEGFLVSEDLSRYKAIYVSGSHLRHEAAEKLAQWVEAGGALYTSGGGLARDEADQPLAALQAVLGLKSRPPPELWSEVRRYGATALSPLRPLSDPPRTETVTGTAPFDGSFAVSVGREALDPADGTEVLARYGDGGAAVTRRAHGKGAAYVAGFYAGVEYSADVLKDGYDTARDFSPDKRRFIAQPAQDAGARPIVDAGCPLVEGVLIRNPKTGERAVTLMNWAYRADWTLAVCSNLAVKIRAPGPVASVRSTALELDVPHETAGADLVVRLPRLDEGDVLCLQGARGGAGKEEPTP